MMRSTNFSPRLLTLEGRALPGTVLSAVDPSLALSLGPTLSSLLDVPATPAQRVVTSNDTEAAAIDLGLGAPATSDHSPANQNLWAPETGLLAPLADPLSTNALTDLQLANALDSHHGHINNGGGVTVALGFLPGSALILNTNTNVSFGDDPTIDGWDNVTIDSAGNMTAAQGDYHTRAIPFTVSGFHFAAQLSAVQDMVGTYDSFGGSATFSTAIQTQITSTDAPGFDNDNCIIPPTFVTFDTGNPRGALFAMDPDPSQNREVGTLEDNTFAVDAIPTGACGSAQGIDWAALANGAIGLPSASGQNDFLIHVSVTPPPGP